MSKKLSELPLTQQVANDGTVVISSASEGSKRIDFATFLQIIGSSGGGGASNLSDLNDVALNSPADGQVLGWDSHFQKWTNKPVDAGSSALGELTDVQLNQPSNNQVLGYDGQTRKWKNMPAISALENLTDVDLEDLTNGQTLVYNETTNKWENADGGSGGTAVYYYTSIEDLPTGSDIQDAFYVVDETVIVEPSRQETPGGGLDLADLVYEVFINNPNDYFNDSDT